jgi:hypothetical protein
MSEMISGKYRLERSLCGRNDWFSIYQGKSDIVAIVNIIMGKAKISSFTQFYYFDSEEIGHMLELMKKAEEIWKHK